jgi:hypothetical protein
MSSDAIGSELSDRGVFDTDSEIKAITRVSEKCIIEFTFGMLGMEEEFSAMVDAWAQLYDDDSVDMFSIVFRPSGMESDIPIIYAYRMSKFINRIKKLRKTNPKYNKLENVIVLVANKSSRAIINILFKITTPMSNVYLVSEPHQVDVAIECIVNDAPPQEKSIDGIKYISAPHVVRNR